MNEEQQCHHATVLGAGNMGKALAETLLANGIAVTTWNRTPEKCKPLISAGAGYALSITDALSVCDLIFICVSDHSATADLLQTDQSNDELQGKTIVQLSTTSSADSMKLSDWVNANGGRYLDGSILGYPDDVKAGNCTIVYSGPRETFEAYHETLTLLGGNALLVGETAGTAPVLDKAVYSYAYTRWLGLFHGAAMCTAAGISLDLYFEQLTLNRMDKIFAQMIEARTYTSVDETLDVHATAFEHVMPTCEALGVDTSLPQLVQKYFDSAVDRGHGASSLAVLYETIRTAKQSDR